MRCKFCNVEVDCKTHICPLCHELLTPENDKEDLSPAFPPKTARAERRRHTHFTATNIYLAASFVIFVASLAVNLGLHQPTKWFLMVGAVLLYGFLTMRNTVMSNNSAWIKAFWQIVMISLILWLAQDHNDIRAHSRYYILRGCTQKQGSSVRYPLPVPDRFRTNNTVCVRSCASGTRKRDLRRFLRGRHCLRDNLRAQRNSR